MARPGGNPDLEKYRFQTNREEPLTEKITLRISTRMAGQIEQIENYREFVRQAIAEKLEKLQDE